MVRLNLRCKEASMTWETLGEKNDLNVYYTYKESSFPKSIFSKNNFHFFVVSSHEMVGTNGVFRVMTRIVGREETALGFVCHRDS